MCETMIDDKLKDDDKYIKNIRKSERESCVFLTSFCPVCFQPPLRACVGYGMRDARDLPLVLSRVVRVNCTFFELKLANNLCLFCNLLQWKCRKYSLCPLGYYH